jgi:hypothetical protein
MLSHCVPDAAGDSARARAWQLLCGAASTHRVSLVTLFDGPVSLLQWRRLHRVVEAAQIETAPAWSPRFSALQRRHAASRLPGLPCTRAFIRTAEAWRDQSGSFDVLLSTHVGLWQVAQTIGANLSICDLHNRPSQAHDWLAHTESFGVIGAARRAWHRTQARRFDLTERSVARQCDLIVLGQELDAHRYATEPCGKLVLPDSVDLTYFDIDAQATSPARQELDGDAPKLVIHADWRHAARSVQGWFKRRVWPQVKQAVPQLDMVYSGPASAPATVQKLQTATVIVSPLQACDRTLWPILQAMAVARPVIAAHESSQVLEARHGEHLLTPRHERDWIEHCVEALRSASVRLQLARGARSFVESRCRNDAAAASLTAVLRKQSHGVEPLARAA